MVYDVVGVSYEHERVRGFNLTLCKCFYGHIWHDVSNNDPGLAPLFNGILCQPCFPRLLSLAKNLKRTFSEDEQLQLQKSLDTAARALAGCAPDAGDARSLKVFAKNARDMSMEVCEAARCTLKQLMTELIDAADSEACKKLESSYFPSLRDFASRVCSSSISHTPVFKNVAEHASVDAPSFVDSELHDTMEETRTSSSTSASQRALLRSCWT